MTKDMSLEDLHHLVMKVQKKHVEVLQQVNQIKAEAMMMSSSIQAKIVNIENIVEQLNVSVEQIQVSFSDLGWLICIAY